MYLAKNNISISMNTSILKILSYRAQNQCNEKAYIFLQDGETESASLTYGELDKQARVIASHLQSLKGERALLLYHSGLEFISAFFGCLYAGVIAVPVYPPKRNQKLSRLLSIVNDSQPVIALTTTSILTDIEQKWSSYAELDHLQLVATDTIESNGKEFVQTEVSPDSLAFLQYTSGSTGTPKGVMVTHGNIIHNQQMIETGFGHSEKTISAGWLPLFHDMGLILQVMHPMYLGTPCIMMPPVAFLQKPIRWLKVISKYRATTSGGPNFAYDLCVNKVKQEDLADLDLSSWDLAFNGAEPVREETLKKFSEKFAACGFKYNTLYPCYGMAESTLFTTGGEKYQSPIIQGVKATDLEQHLIVKTEILSPESRVFVGCGHPYLDTKVIIVNPESLTSCSPKQVGEIWVSSPSVAAGYWNRPDATKETFQAYVKDTGSGPFLRTGDLGFVNHGELFVTGRLKDVIIIRGRNYYPQDIELTIEKSHPSLRANCSAAFTIEIEGEEGLVVACEVERTHLRKLNNSEVIKEIKIAVSTEYQLEISGVALLKTGSIPKTSSGKIQRRTCKQKFLENNLNLVGKWQKVIENDQNITTPNSGLNHQYNSQKKQSKTVAEIETGLTNKIAQVLEIAPDEIDFKQPFSAYGLDSVKAVSIAEVLEQWLGISVTPTIVYDYPTPRSLANYLGQKKSIKEYFYKEKRTTKSSSVAIIGKGCRFPGSNNPQVFWSNLRSATDAITRVPVERWQSDNGWGGFLEQVDQFDAQFFNLSPRETINIDPQQRLLLEVSWEALENAGLAAEQLIGTRGGVFIGISSVDYAKLSGNLNNTQAYYATGNALSIAANRLSYFLDWHGPSLAIDTACSSSLVAVHQACKSLLEGESDIALAGGVNLILTPQLNLTFSEAGMISADGRCKTFDAEADGYVRGEGCGVVVLKRLDDAIRDGDNIQAIIRGSAVNQDGLTNGLTAPNGNSQQEVIRLALAKAGVKPSQISYVETHGTGTSLGDPIEVNSLKEVLSEGRESNQTCWIGSAKTNIGHLEAAAGIVGLIKVVLQIENQEIPSNLHLKQLNPYIKIENTNIQIPTSLQPWVTGEEKRLAGVSSFGFGGTNAHIIVEEAPQKVKTEDELSRPIHLLTLSAKSKNALLDKVSDYQNYLETHSSLDFVDICFTANTGRSHFDHRLAIIASDKQELTDKLALISAKEEVNGVFTGKLPTNHKSPLIAFLFTGQGSQYINMGRQLYETQPVFRQALEQCDKILQIYLEKSILNIIYPKDNSDLDNSLINQTAYTQPALFAIEYALYKLWSSWGIKPSMVMGHSVGEYVAATVAGVFSLEDGLKLICHRGRLIQQLPHGGKMLSIMASHEQVKQFIAPYSQFVAIAAINGPQSVVISGESEAIGKVKEILDSHQIKTKQLQVSHAFHSHLMEPMLVEFEVVASEITYNQPSIPLISNVTGIRADESITTANYWVNHVRQSVNFAQGMETLYEEGCQIFLEIGSKPTLLGMGRQCLPKDAGVWLPSVRPSQLDWQQMLQSLGELYVRGVKVDWLGFDKDYFRNKVTLPTYPFQRQRYWIETEHNQHTGTEDLIKEKDNIIKKTVETPTRRDKIIQQLSSLIFQALGFDASSEIDIHHNLLEMGADSLTLMEIGSKVEKIYGINIPIRKFFEELTTLDALATYIDINLPPEWEIQSQSDKNLQQSAQFPSENSSIEPKINDKGFETFREKIIQQQLEVMSDIMSKQLEVLQYNGTSTQKTFSKINKQFQSASATSLTSFTADSSHKIQNNQNSPTFELNQALNSEQKSYLEKFIAAYTRKTQKCKEKALAYRSVLADKRAAVSFRLELKELKYPIVGESSSGSRMWDIDGNEYIDISMGFGVHLFGHQPKFVIEALQNQLEVGMQIGPQAKLAGEVAQLIHELTGMERVAFCNSGTEAVMTALRIARLTTGRDKIVMFSGAYHGQFDGTLAVRSPNSLDGNFKAAPMLPGVLQKMVDDVIVLRYGASQSLDIIKAHSHELAAVLVEPVQSRQPDLQPKEFLQQLRQLTQEVDIPLIFDEVITGFRIHPGGTQAWFGIDADIATYGKCVGGGIPMGIIAGKAIYMDGLDGGHWNYGDASYPQKPQTFFGGTFNKNPLSMAAARAVLQHLKSQGTALQENLNQRTSKLITTLNAYFETENLPIRMVNFGSIFRFVLSGNVSYLFQPIELEIMFYNLIQKGVYIWEGRTCFLSTSHTDEDIDYIISAVKDCISEMRQGGFFQNNKQQNYHTEVKETERLRGEL